MAVFSNQHQFTFKGTDAITGEALEGMFTFNKILSYGQQLRFDQLYRKYLGEGDPRFASEEAKVRATVLAEINSSLVSAPKFWREKGDGLALLDDDVATEIWTKIREIQNEVSAARAEKDKAAAEALKTKIEKDALAMDAVKKED